MSPPAPRAGGPVYYTAQMTGKLGILDPAIGQVEEIPLGREFGAARRRRRPRRRAVDHRRRPERDRSRRRGDAGGARWPLPREAAIREPQHADLRSQRRVWFTGQSGYYGRLDPARGDDRRCGRRRAVRGPYGIATTPRATSISSRSPAITSRASTPTTGNATVIEPPTPRPGRAARLVRLAGPPLGQLLEHRPGRHVRPATRTLARMEAAGPGPQAYSVWVDAARQGLADRMVGERDRALRSRSPRNSTAFRRTARAARVRQMLGRAGEAWGAESGTDRLVMVPAH